MDHLFELCIEVSNSLEVELIQQLKELEDEVRMRERLSTHLWRLKSRFTWFKIGDSPSHYFKLVTTKRIWEMIKILAISDDRLMEDRNEIMHGVYEHY